MDKRDKQIKGPTFRATPPVLQSPGLSIYLTTTTPKRKQNALSVKARRAHARIFLPTLPTTVLFLCCKATEERGNDTMRPEGRSHRSFSEATYIQSLDRTLENKNSGTPKQSSRTHQRFKIRKAHFPPWRAIHKSLSLPGVHACQRSNQQILAASPPSLLSRNPLFQRWHLLQQRQGRYGGKRQVLLRLLDATGGVMCTPLTCRSSGRVLVPMACRKQPRFAPPAS